MHAKIACLIELIMIRFRAFVEVCVCVGGGAKIVVIDSFGGKSKQSCFLFKVLIPLKTTNSLNKVHVHVVKTKCKKTF